MPNITIKVSEELKKKMDKLTEVSWSDVSRQAIERYIEMRQSTNPKVMETLQRMKMAEERDGYVFGQKLAEKIVEILTFDEIATLKDEWATAPEWLDPETDYKILEWLGVKYSGEKWGVDDRNCKQFLSDSLKKGTLIWLLKFITNDEKTKDHKNETFIWSAVRSIMEALG